MMTFILALALILLGAYAQARAWQARNAQKRLKNLDRFVSEFMVARDPNAPDYNLAELPEFHDKNRPS